MAAFEPRRKAQTYGKVQRARQQQFMSQDRFYEQTTRSESYELLSDGSTSESARKRAKNSSAGFSREGSRDSDSVHSEAEARGSRTRSVEIHSDGGHEFSQKLTPFTSAAVMRRGNTGSRSTSAGLQNDPSDNSDVFDVPNSSGDEAKSSKPKVIRKPAPMKRKLSNTTTKVETTKARGGAPKTAKSSTSVNSVNRGTQSQISNTAQVAPPAKPLASRKKARPKTPPPRPRAKLSSPLSSASISSFESISPVPHTPQKTPKASSMHSMVSASPGLLSLQSLDIRSPIRRTPKTSRKTTPLEDSPDRMSTASSIADVLDFSESLLSGKRMGSVDPDETPRKRMSLDLPDFATPRRKKRLIDVLADEVDRSPRKHESTEESESGSESEVEADQTVIATSNYVRPKDVPILEEDEMVIDSQEAVSRRQGPASTNTGRPRITYASQRSYLAEELDLSMPLTDVPIIPELQGILESSQSKARNTSNIFDMPDTDGLQPKSAIKSIHELRQAGTNKRSLEEMEALMEDIEAHGPSNTSRRRVGLLTAAQKFSTQGFPERFVESGFDNRLAEGLASEQDMLSICALGFMTICLLRVDSSCFHNRDILSRIFAMMGSLLDENRSLQMIGRDRKSNMSKYAQNVLGEFASSVKRAKVWTVEDGIVTPQIIALLAVHAVSQTGSGPDILTQKASETTIRVLLHLLTQVGGNITDATMHPNDRASLDFLLSILNPYVTRTDAYSDETVWTPSVYKFLATFLPATFTWGFPQAADMQMQVLTFYLNLSHENEVLCDKLAQSRYLSSLIKHVGAAFARLDRTTTEDEQEAVLQPLIIVLAILINTTESSAKAREAIAVEKDPEAGFDALVKVFLNRQDGIARADSIEKSKANVALGYVSVLLAMLSEVPDLCRQLKSRIPGQKLAPLIDTLKQFNEVHQKVDQAGGSQDGQVERMQAAIKRLSDV